MRKRLFFLIAIVIICVAAFGFYMYNKPRVSLSNQESSFNIDAQELYDKYQSDETTADKQFADKIITVRGTVSDTQQTDSSLNLTLQSTGMGGINCSFATTSDKITAPQKGSPVTIKGRCIGFLMDVNLVDCIIIEPATP